MKPAIYILTFCFLSSCGQSNSKEKTTTIADNIETENEVQNSKEDNKSNEDYRKQSLSGFEKATLYKLTDIISIDLNGDGIADKAFYQKENETSGIIIKHGKTNEEFRIGFGKKFSSCSDDFDCNWVDYWGLVEDKETIETTFNEDGDVSGTKEIKLQNPSIILGADEVGGGLITFKNGKYVWIHQSC
jgi:hypothetical protein